MLGRAVWLSAIAGCFNPSPPQGTPCGAGGACPSGQRCNTAGVCVVGPDELVDAPGAVDAPLVPDGTTPPPPGWYATTPLPAARSLLCAVAGGGRVYAIGGSLMGDEQTTVWFASIADNGSLSSWTPTTELPTPTRWHACALDLASESIYVLGGDLGTTAKTVVLRASITSSGVGAWETQPALPSGRRGLGAAVIGGRLYALGGEQADGFELRATVFVAPIGLDGSLGAWTATTSLPMPDYMFGTAVAGDTVYLTGGYTGGLRVDHAIAGDDALGPYEGGTELSRTRERHVSVAVEGHLYVMGGEPVFNGTNLATAERAPITPASVGSWEALPDLIDPVAYAAAAADRGYIYVLGGSTEDDGQLAGVQLLVPP